jgi:hypothetical protein
MKKTLYILLTAFLMLGTQAYPVSKLNENKVHLNQDYTVYITKTGEKYHSSGCRYLSRSKISISKKKALAAGFGACKVCKP